MDVAFDSAEEISRAIHFFSPNRGLCRPVKLSYSLVRRSTSSCEISNLSLAMAFSLCLITRSQSHPTRHRTLQTSSRSSHGIRIVSPTPGLCLHHDRHHKRPQNVGRGVGQRHDRIDRPHRGGHRDSVVVLFRSFRHSANAALQELFTQPCSFLRVDKVALIART
jgi:hypothetical protein